MKYLTNIDLNKNELQNAALHKLGSAPTTPTEGQVYQNTTDHRAYRWNGTAWIAMDAEGATMTGANIVTAINGSVSIIDADNLALSGKQDAGNELTALQALADTAGFLKKTGDGAYSIDTSTYGTSNLAVADLTGTNMTLGGSAVVGVATTASRSDHKHAITNPALDSLAATTDVTTLNATTTSHGLLLKATAPAANILNVVGIANGETSYTNKALFDATTPVAIGTASAGTSLVAAHRDHVHTISLTGDVTSTTGVGTTIAAKAVTLAKMNDIATQTVIGRNTALTGVPEELTMTTLKTMLGIDTVISNSHAQNTDTGTSSATFTIGTSGVKIKNVTGTELQVRNNGDTGYADLRVNNLVVEGTTTTINSNTVNIGDSEIELNSDIATSAGNSDGGLAIKRLMADNVTRKDAKLTFNDSTSRWQTTTGAVTGTLVTNQLANKVSAQVGDTAATSFVITHNLNSRAVVVSVCETGSPYNDVITDVAKTTLDTITVSFAVAPTSNQYTVTIIG
ncbi:MAG: hypothetical protein WCO84_01355 [bacterium]